MKIFFQKINWKSLIISSDPSKTAEHFESHIKLAMLNYIPSRTLKPKRQLGNLWFDHNCDQTRKKLLSAWKIFKQKLSATSAEIYKREKWGYYFALKRARRNFQLKINEDILSSTSSSDWWSHIRKLQPRSSPSILTMRTANNTVTDETNQIASTLNEFLLHTRNQNLQPTTLPYQV